MYNLISKATINKGFSLILLGLACFYIPSVSHADAEFDHHPEACIAPQLKIPAWTDARGWDNDAYQSTITLANVTADDDLELLGRDTAGVVVHVFEIDPDLGWWGAWMPKYSADNRKPDLADPQWQSPDHYATIRYLDLDGNGIDEMVAYENGPKGRGLLAFSFKGGDGQAGGNWELLNDAGFKLPKGTDWALEDYYTGFKVGKVLAGNAEQLLLHSSQGIIGLSWDTGKSNFQLLADPAKKGFFDISWHDHRYLDTIRTADVDGDGIDEVIGRSAAGLMAVKYQPGKGWLLLAKPNEILNDKEAHLPRYYSTMIWGRFIAPDKDSLAIWTPKGVQLVDLSANNTWRRRISGTGLVPDRNDPAKHLINLRAADINKDGLDELHFNYSYSGAIHSFGFAAKAKKWQAINTGNTEADETLLARLSTVAYGDIDGDGLAEAVGRSSDGIVSYFYDSAEKRWEENYSCGLPPFSGRQAKAYAAMNQMQFNGSTEFRHQYNDDSNSRANKDFLQAHKIRPAGDDTSYDQRDWEAVRSQLLREIGWADATLSVFKVQRDSFSEQYTTEWESMDTVGNDLLADLNEDDSIDIKAILLNLATSAVDMVTDGIASKVFSKKSLIGKAITKGASMLIGAGVEALAGDVFPDTPIVANVNKLKNELLDTRQGSQKQLNLWAREITGLKAQEGDLGTMAAVSLLHQRGYWPANFSTDAYFEDKRRWNFKRWLYQQIISTVYEIHIYDCQPGGLCPEASASRTRLCYQWNHKPVIHVADKNCINWGNTGGVVWVYRAIEKKGDNWTATLPDEVNHVITRKLSDACQQDGGYFVDSCNLGLPMNDLLYMSDGWNFELRNNSIYVNNDSQLKQKLSCSGLDATIIGEREGGVIFGTPEADVIYAFDNDDVIYSGGGNDVICSGNGNDRVYGGPGDDLIILGYGDDFAAGGDGDDRLYGDAGEDILLGENGDDVLLGGPGTDTLDGGDNIDVIYGGPMNAGDDCTGEEMYFCDPEETLVDMD